MSTILLLLGSNVFITLAWYGHLKYGHGWPLWKAQGMSGAIHHSSRIAREDEDFDLSIVWIERTIDQIKEKLK